MGKNDLNTKLYIGVMSGTSLDGIDIALCSIDDNSIQTLQTKEYPFDKQIKEDVLTAILNPITLEFLGTLNHKLALMYTNAIKDFLKEFEVKAEKIIAIGLHGQTIWHSPNKPYPFSMQLGDGSFVAKNLQIDVVNDFRSGDIANNGQGAPLTPAFHKSLFDDKQTAVLNLGGIANITILTKEYLGFDIGVANILSDYWIQKNQKTPFDKDGVWAKSGKVNEELLKVLLDDPYFKKLPPKSTGREYFNASWLEDKLKSFSSISAVDIQATLLEFVSIPIIEALKTKEIKRLIVCGGGAQNKYLMEKLSNKLNKIKVIKSDELGIDSNFLEAIAFAWLAFKRINHQAIDLSSITGSSKPTILGAIHGKD
ncbi:anhydro-N-acetylmuramic acid kinase [Arcobacter arenosus]|uniref:anhydro-N-acetylmuramic acid kinase n=1 Tax=Arcobacter arenosus TaxID=2576037 RepID=UPI003BACC33F